MILVRAASLAAVKESCNQKNSCLISLFALLANGCTGCLFLAFYWHTDLNEKFGSIFLWGQVSNESQYT
jgi:hypothetical protein